MCPIPFAFGIQNPLGRTSPFQAVTAAVDERISSKMRSKPAKTGHGAETPPVGAAAHAPAATRQSVWKHGPHPFGTARVRKRAVGVGASQPSCQHTPAVGSTTVRECPTRSDPRQNPAKTGQSRTESDTHLDSDSPESGSSRPSGVHPWSFGQQANAQRSTPRSGQNRPRVVSPSPPPRVPPSLPRPSASFRGQISFPSFRVFRGQPS